jgi:phage shock protein A
MGNNSKYNKADFIKFIISTVEHEISDKEKAKEFLSSQGVDIDSMLSDSMKRLKRLQLQIAAEKTKAEMLLAEQAKQKASEWVDDLLSKIDFSLQDLVKEEELTMSFRNIEQLSKDDIRKILVKHFTLKFLEEQAKKRK